MHLLTPGKCSNLNILSLLEKVNQFYDIFSVNQFLVFSSFTEMVDI